MSAAQFPGIFRALEALGLDSDAILASSGIPQSIARDPSARFDAALSNRFWAQVEAHSGDPAIGLWLGEAYARAGLQIQGLEGYLSRHCPTLRRVLENLSRFAPLIDDRSQLILSEHGEFASVRYFRASQLARPAPATETMFTVMHRFSCQYVRGYRLSAVYLRRRRPRRAQCYEQVFGVAPSFGAEHDELWCERSMLDLPLVGADPALGRILEAHAEELMKRVPAPDNASLTGRLKSTIAKELPGRALDLQGVARELAMSPRTLRRRLEALGTRYQELVDEVRRERACQLLADTDISVLEVAEQLGFRSPSAFQRAFARWLGCPPSHYRAKLREGGAEA